MPLAMAMSVLLRTNLMVSSVRLVTRSSGSLLKCGMACFVANKQRGKNKHCAWPGGVGPLTEDAAQSIVQPAEGGEDEDETKAIDL